MCGPVVPGTLYQSGGSAPAMPSLPPSAPKPANWADVVQTKNNTYDIERMAALSSDTIFASNLGTATTAGKKVLLGE
jgi:hypothetical protein